MPSIGELCALWKARNDVNNSIQKTGGTQTSANSYFSSSQKENGNTFAWGIIFESVGSFSAGTIGGINKHDTNSVCAVRAFN